MEKMSLESEAAMSETLPQREEVIVRRVAQGLERLSGRHKRLRRTNTGLLVSGVLTSALATLVTGVTAASGPVIGEGPPGWRLACAVGAVFSFGATLTVGLSQSLRVSDRLAETRECSGRLRALDIALTTGSRSWHNVAMEYEELVKAYPDIVE
jgi:hypothetical protein